MDRKMIGIISALLIVTILILLYLKFIPNSEEVNSLNNPNSKSNYVENYFDKNEVIDIYLTLSESDFENMMQNPTKEEYKEATVIVDGTQIDYVGLRVKGNSSLNMVTSSDSERYSFKVDFDQYIMGQSLDGLTKLNLNNSVSDPSYMREYLSYSLLEEMGIPTPAYCYANVYVNGELIGLYLAVEGIEESFIERYYQSSYGTLYKPEGQGSDLVYIDDQIESYSGINLVTDLKNDDNKELLNMIKALNAGEDLEKYLNIDEILRYFAVNTVLVNMDSYQSNLKHNYYLYEEDGVFSILPWDYNMSFAGFNMGMDTQNATSLYIDNPLSGTSLEQSPLLSKLLEVEEYRELYHQYISEFIDGPFSFETMSVEIERIANMIRPYLEKDPTKFYTMEQFEEALDEGSTQQNIINNSNDSEMAMKIVQEQLEASKEKIGDPRAGGNKNMLEGNAIGLKKFVNERISNLSKQLSGELPSTGDIEGDTESIPVQANNFADNPQGRQQNMPPVPAGAEGQPAFDRKMQPFEGNQQRTTDVTDQYYLVAGTILVLLITLIFVFKKKTKYMI
ncbi:MAG: CotH kinase family protein [Vulcanibacillus sp.]